MEPIGAEGQWTSLSGICTAEEADFMALLLSTNHSSAVPNSTTYQLNESSSVWPGHESLTSMAGNYGALHCSLELTDTNLYSFSRGYSNVFPTSTNEVQYCLSDSHEPIMTSATKNCSTSFDFLGGNLKTSNSYHNIQRDDCLNVQETSDGSQNKPQAESTMEDKITPSDENPIKRSRSSENVKVDKRVKSKKKQKLVSNNEEEINGINLSGTSANGVKSSSSCSSGDDDYSINGGQETSNGGLVSSSSLSPKEASALNSDGKTRARRGSATDPQSLYARKRRERINERLRILQNLVPNGTKVDISTMLEEAVQYVKFLQLQIKLLSSDELWMYAPIAYNGKDIGLDHLKLTIAKQ